MRKILCWAVVVAAIASLGQRGVAADRQWAGAGSSSDWDDFTKGNPLDIGAISGYLNWGDYAELPGVLDHVILSGSFDSGRTIPLNAPREIGSLTISTPGALTLGVGEALKLNHGLLEDVTGGVDPYAHLIRSGVFMQPTESTVKVENQGTLTLFGGLFGEKVTKTGTGTLEIGTRLNDPLNQLGASSSLRSLHITGGKVQLGNVEFTEPSIAGLILNTSTRVIVRGTVTANRALGPTDAFSSISNVIEVVSGGFFQAGSIERKLRLEVHTGGVAIVPALGSDTVVFVDGGVAQLAGLNDESLVDIRGGTVQLMGSSFAGARFSFASNAAPSTLDLGGQTVTGADLGAIDFNTQGVVVRNGTLSGVSQPGLGRIRVIDAVLECNLVGIPGGTHTSKLELEFATFRAIRPETTPNTEVEITGAGTIEVPAMAGPLKLVGGLSSHSTGAFLFSKTGAGTLEFTKHGTFAGEVDVSGGKLVFSATEGAGKFSKMTVRPGATLQLNQANATVATTQISVSAPPIFPPSSVPAGRFEFVGDQTFAAVHVDGGVVASLGASNATLNAPLNFTAAGGVFDVAGGGALALTGPIANSNGGITKIGAGTLVLPGANDATGGVTVRGGVVRVGNDRGLGPVPGVFLQGVVQLDGGGLHLPSSFRAHANRGVILGAGGGRFDVDQLQTIIFDGKIEGPGALTKVGAGTLAIGGAFDSIGGVDVEQGVLQIQELASDPLTTIAGPVSVAPGASITQAAVTKFTGRADIDGSVFAGAQLAEFAGILAGNGSVNSFGVGQIRVTGQLSPGHSVGRLLANGAISLSGDYLAELASASPDGYDQLVVNGNATLGGSLSVLLLNAFAPKAGDRFTLISGGRLAGEFSSYNLPALKAGLFWDVSQVRQTGTLAVVPEPSTVILAALAFCVSARVPSLRRRKTIGESGRTGC